MSRTYGKLYLKGDYWIVKGEPHVLLRMKRVFGKANAQIVGQVKLKNTPENCRDLDWFVQRYPLELPNSKELDRGCRLHEDNIAILEELMDPNYKAPTVDLAIPLRDYQGRAVHVYLTKKALLVGDDVGLGKTAIAIGSFTNPKTLPAVVVSLAFLPKQWEAEIKKFMPGLTVHILKCSTPYELPRENGRGPDVVITTYHKLHGWAQVLRKYANSIVFDEIQELRRTGSFKYMAAQGITEEVRYKIGLSATPVYNYGGEIFNVVNVLSRDALGSRDEFMREWCTNYGKVVENPRALGAHLRENFIMLRRTRKDVSRELPPHSRIPVTIDADARELHRMTDDAIELAKIILDRAGGSSQDRWEASGQFDMLMRQATGIAKAPYVADFVKMLVESDQKVLLYGWHREVYTIWENKFGFADIKSVFFTGKETPKQKHAAKEAFVNGEAQVMIMSLRAGQGVDGLQHVCNTVVFGELDWSPGVMEQCTGRLFRDGQKNNVSSYYLIADDGADPIIADVLGVKREQGEGIRNPDHPVVERLSPDRVKNLKSLAEDFLKRRKVKLPQAKQAG